MDNAPYQSVQTDRAPTQANKKEELVAWLQSKGVEANMSMLTAELLKLVKLNKPAQIKYEIDKMASDSGHRVILTPPYHCQYNAIEMIWAQVKGYAARHNTEAPSTANKMLKLLNEACQHVTKEDWRKVVEKTKNIILQHFDRDVRVDSILDQEFVISVCESSSDADSSSSEDFASSE